MINYLKKILLYLILFIILYLFLNFISTKFNNRVEKKLLINDQINYLITRYYNKFNHLRDLNDKRYEYEENINNLIFSVINPFNDSNKLNILISGDSWAVGPIVHKKLLIMLKKFLVNNNIGLITSGVSSFSPSLMSAQLDVLNQDYDIFPNVIISFIDQTDIGDEICRYKSKRIFTKGKVNVKAFNKEDAMAGHVYLYDFLLKDFNIFKSKNNNLIKSYNYFFNRVNFVISKKKANKCGFEKVMSYVKNTPSKKDIKYFKSVVDQYIQNVFYNYEDLNQLILISHPHRDHILNKYKFDISEIVLSSVENSKNRDRILVIKTLDFIDKKNLNDFYDNKEDSTGSHLSKDYYRSFILKILERISQTN